MLELDKTNFEELVLKSEKPVFVDSWSDGCEACKELMPGVHELAEKYGDKMVFASLNIKGARRLAISQKVMGLPAMIIYKDGEILDRMSPEQVDEDIDNIESFINKYYETL
jgi:thioredoxin 1